MIKENSLFDLSKKQNIFNILVYYLIMFLVYLIVHILVCNLLTYIHSMINPNIQNNTYTNNFLLGYKISVTFSLITFPAFVLLYSFLFFIKRNLYRNPIAYILVIVALVCPPFLGFAFISYLALLETKLSEINKKHTPITTGDLQEVEEKEEKENSSTLEHWKNLRGK